MKQKLNKILSIILLFVYLASSLGFVSEQHNCSCCKINNQCESDIETAPKCCEPKIKLPKCCAGKSVSVKFIEKNCNCDKIKCSTVEYHKNEHFSFNVEFSYKLSKINKTFSILVTPDKSKEELIEIKATEENPPPSLYRDFAFLIEVSQIKIPAASLV